MPLNLVKNMQVSMGQWTMLFSQFPYTRYWLLQNGTLEWFQRGVNSGKHVQIGKYFVLGTEITTAHYCL